MSEHWGKPTHVRPTDVPPPTPEQIALYRIYELSAGHLVRSDERTSWLIDIGPHFR